MHDFERLDELAKLMAQKEVLTKKRKRIAEELSTLSHEEIRLQSELKKETSDYRKLEGLSVKKLLKLFSDHYEEEKDREFREMQLAQFKHDELLARIQADQEEINSLTEQIDALAGIDMEYERLLAAKRVWATQKGITSLDAFEPVILNLKTRSKEIDEAIIAARKLLLSLTSAKEDLSSAKNWGMFDILGGDLISSMVKHDHIKRASGYIQDSSEKAQLLSRELDDLKLVLSIEMVEIDALSKTFDVFFDNIFSDLSVQEEINRAYDSINANYDTTELLLDQLMKLQSETLLAIQDVTKKRNEVLLSL